MLWRLSLADVQCDGPFSVFPDTERLLTVVSGKGMDLHGPDTTFAARPLAPLRFPGDIPVDGICLDGPVQNFNLIFDPRRIEADVSLMDGQLHDSATHESRVALHVLSGGISVAGCAGLNLGDTGLFNPEELALCDVSAAQFLQVSLRRI